ncbi:pesticin C-terminus-like muramidase [Dyella sp.]|uniref:pesticin C-terminus-like muramidase n=1 Tax=Dyella sp. TaxID=1869338 RepID=UPI002FD89361
MEFRRLSIAIVCALSSYGGSLAARPADVQTYSPNDRVPDDTSSSTKGLGKEVCATDANGLNACGTSSPMRALTPDEVHLIMGANMETVVVSAPVVDPPPIGGVPGGGGNPGGGGGGGNPGHGGYDHAHCMPVLEEVNRTDADYIYGNEGGVQTLGYTLPVDQFPNSGVTIGAGVDLGQQSAAGLQALGVAQSIIDVPNPYFGLKGQDALNAMNEHGKPSLSSDDAAALSAALMNHTWAVVQAAYDATPLDVSFDQLPAEAQTVIVDVAYPNGPYFANSAPKFWGEIMNGKWSDAANELQHWYADGHTDPRYERDAAKLNDAISQGRLPSEDTFGACLD